VPKQSAGVLLFRKSTSGIEVLLIHPGGPFWARKDDGAWSIPKGEIQTGEEPFEAAKREFAEEMGVVCPDGDFLQLKPVRQPGGKIVHAWAIESDFDLRQFKSNTFSIEWPPKSGKLRDFPEADQARWFSIDEARQKILKGQLPLLDELLS
jgi:predicted NUDIX family NTP pyrophosphohydrolase